MIRVIIGTVAVLAGFAVVERSVEATWGLAGSCPPPQSHAAAYRGEPVSYRAEPNGSREDPQSVAEKRPAPSVPPCPEPVEAPKPRSSGH